MTFVPASYFPAATGSHGISLGHATHVLRATYYHPGHDARRNLPQHTWVIYGATTRRAVCSGNSDSASGIAELSMTPADYAADTEFALCICPADPTAQRAAFTANEMWIDLEHEQWATPHPAAIGTNVERRRLLRIPLWTTELKAHIGGGFSTPPSRGAPHFESTGRISSSDFVSQGTVASPWEFQIDHQLLSMTVEYFFFNFPQGHEQAVPPGLLVEAVTLAGQRLGAATAYQPQDGRVYLILDAPQAAPLPAHRHRWADIHLQFRYSRYSYVDAAQAPPAAPAQDQRLTMGSPAPRHRYWLPREWHSLGMRARMQPSAAAPLAAPGPWSDVQQDLEAHNPARPHVRFHLDDVLVVNADGDELRVRDPIDVTLLDHLLQVIDPVNAEPYRSDLRIDAAVIPAGSLFSLGRAATAPTTVADLQPRLIYINGAFHDLINTFRLGTLGQTERVGMRAARANRHPVANFRNGNPHMNGQGRYELHGVPQGDTVDPASGQPLQHLLLFVPLRWVNRGVAGAEERAFHQNLRMAAERWSQGSPAFANTKPYQVVARDPALRGGQMTRLRAYFGVVTRDHALTIRLRPGSRRSFLRGRTMVYFTPAIQRDNTAAGGARQDSDGVNLAWHTLAHEFGHVMGLPDEYPEPLDVDAIAAAVDGVWRVPRLMQYRQPQPFTGGIRPYYGDESAMMYGNRLPRLRHFWHHLRAYDREEVFNSMRPQPVLLRHDTLGGGLDYATPNDVNPWQAIADRRMPRERAHLFLVPVGEDEGTVENMFALPAAPPRGTHGVPVPAARPAPGRFDGILVVRLRYRFQFDRRISVADRGTAMTDGFHDRYFFDEAASPRIRFQLAGGTQMQRIAILFQPQYTYQNRWEIAPPDQTLVIHPDPATEHEPFLEDRLPDTIQLHLAQLSAWPLLRYAMGLDSFQVIAAVAGPPPAPAHRIPDTRPFSAADLTSLAAEVDQMLGDPVGTRRVQNL